MSDSNNNGNKVGFYIDLDELFKFCSNAIEMGNNYHQKEISDTYEHDENDGGVKLSQKIVHEVISPNDNNVDEHKFTIIKELLDVLLLSEDKDIMETSIGYKLAVNTLLNKGIIK